MIRVEKIGNATLYLGDCDDILPSIPKVDAVITDPPYGISYISNHRNDGPTLAIHGDQSAPTHLVCGIADKIKDGGAIYLATRFDVSFQWVNAIEQSGMIVKTPIYWDKGNHTAGDLEGDFGAQVEIFLFAHKGRHTLRGSRLANLWRVPRDPASDHPTPKPVDLMGRMVRCSTDAGGIVLDPFMGSGSTGVAAILEGRHFVGVEIEEKYFDIACKRIVAAQANVPLFEPTELTQQSTSRQGLFGEVD